MSVISQLQFILSADAARLRRDLARAEGPVNKFSAAAKGMGKILSGVFATVGVAVFAKEVVSLGIKAEGVKLAFERLNNPTLLNDLRKATNNTVNDLELMKAAVNANNFKIPIEQVGKFLEFASVRAKETGESVEFLVDSIIKGVARKSLPILDNLGLNTALISKEFQKTGDMAQAVGNIVEREMLSTIDATSLAGTSVEQLKVKWENFKLSLGSGLAPRINDTILAFRALGRDLTAIFDEIKYSMRAAFLGEDNAGGSGGGGAVTAQKRGAINAAAYIKKLEEATSSGRVSQKQYFEELTRQSGIAAQNIKLFAEKMQTARSSELQGLKDAREMWVAYKDSIDAAIPSAGRKRELTDEEKATLKWQFEKSKEYLRKLIDGQAGVGSGLGNVKSKTNISENTAKYDQYGNLVGGQQHMDQLASSKNVLPKVWESFYGLQPRVITPLISTTTELIDTNSLLFESYRKIAGALREVGQVSAMTSNAFMMASEGQIKSVEDLSRAIYSAAREQIAASLAKGIASSVETALSSVPFPFNLVAAGIAGASAGALFNTFVPKLATGGIVPGGFPNDTYPAMLSSGETVIPKPKKLGAHGGGDVNVRGVIFGDNLLIVNQRSNTRYNRVRGY